jgi:PAS domain S-box-containing protein
MPDELSRVKRALKCLTSCSRAVMQATEEARLLQKVCQILVEEGGYRLAWVGYAEEGGDKRILPVSQAGYEAGYLETLKLTWANRKRGRGPSGTAIRTGAPAAARNILTDPSFAPWRAEALKRGYASSIALPLKAEGKTFGMFAIYAAEPDAFDAEEMGLLEELADHMAYGIMALRTRAERQQAQEMLKKAHEELERRVEERTAELRRANEQLLQEMEGRRKVQEKLQESENRFRTLFQSAANIALLLSLDGRILEFNEEAEAVTGWPRQEALGKNAFDLLFPERLRPQCDEHLISVREGESARGYDLPLKLRDGRERFCLWNCSLFQDIKGHPAGIVVMGQDITEHRQAAEALKAERQRLYSLLDELPAYIYLQGKDYTLPFVNRVFKETFGDPQGRRCYEVLHGREHPCIECSAAEVFKTQTPREWEWTSQEGRTYQLYDLPFADIDGSPLVLEMGIEITERKKAEGSLKESEQRLRLLSSQLLTAQEDERQRISRELHDELGQSLHVMKFLLSSIKDKAVRGKTPKGLAQDCDNLLHYLAEIIEKVRRLARGLNPMVIEKLGLFSALKYLAEEFARRLQFNWNLVNLQEADIDRLFSPRIQLNIYRVFQESLTNSVKHAQASRIDLTIEKGNGVINFVIQDNGKGFDMELLRSKEGKGPGIGVAIMEERVRQAKGVLEITSRPGAGTRVAFQIPIQGEEKDGASVQNTAG